MTLGERIREVRKSLKMTMDQFGERIGVTKSTISNIENGNRNATEHMIKSICREFEVNEEWLRTGAGGSDNMFKKMTADEQAYNRFGYIMENASPAKKAALSMLLELVYSAPDDSWDAIVRQFEELKKEGQAAFPIIPLIN